MKPALVLTLLLALAALLASCGGSGDSTATPTLASASPSSVRTVTATPQGQKTALPTEAPTVSVAPTAPGDTPTAPPVSVQGTPAAAPADQAGFAAQFAGHDVSFGDCLYRPTTGVATCAGVLYALDPPLVGQDITCQLWIVDGSPKALACSAVQPQGTTYYEVEGGG